MNTISLIFTACEVDTTGKGWVDNAIVNKICTMYGRVVTGYSDSRDHRYHNTGGGGGGCGQFGKGGARSDGTVICRNLKKWLACLK